MPYKSLAQERFFHSAGAKKAGISPATVKEFDKASKGMKMPERASSNNCPSCKAGINHSHQMNMK